MKPHSGDSQRAGEVPPLEAFHNGYYWFIEAVTILQADAETQCQRMGDYNVALELKEDVGAGKYLAKSELFCDRERAAILALVESLEAVPSRAPTSSRGGASAGPCQSWPW